MVLPGRIGHAFPAAAGPLDPASAPLRFRHSILSAIIAFDPAAGGIARDGAPGQNRTAISGFGGQYSIH